MPIEELTFGPGLRGCAQPGPGERVLWLHGYTLDSSIWAELWARLPSWYHLGLDLPGHGASAPLPLNATVGSLAEQIGALALSQGVRHIVGLSFGTLLALQTTIAFPQGFRSLTLAAPGLVGGPEDPHTPQRYRELAQLFWQCGPGPWMTELWMRDPPAIFAGTAAHPELRQRLAAVIDRYSWAELRSGAMRHMFLPAQTPALLATALTPTLVLLGDAEMPAFRSAAATLNANLPRCRSALLPQSGHLCLLERPELAASLVAEHLHAHAA
jgi:pimeloyl-ACP methyl ester carboxylesterase